MFWLRNLWKALGIRTWSRKPKEELNVWGREHLSQPPWIKDPSALLSLTRKVTLVFWRSAPPHPSHPPTFTVESKQVCLVTGESFSCCFGAVPRAYGTHHSNATLFVHWAAIQAQSLRHKCVLVCVCVNVFCRCGFVCFWNLLPHQHQNIAAVLPPNFLVAKLYGKPGEKKKKRESRGRKNSALRPNFTDVVPSPNC